MKRIALSLMILLAGIPLTQAAPGLTTARDGPGHAKMEINPAPSIKVILSGFLLVRFRGTDNPCEVGIPKTGGKHNLNLYVVKLQRGKAPEVVYSYWGTPKDSIWLGVFRPKYPGIRRFETGTFDPAESDPHDFRWTVDLEGPEYYNKLLEWDTDRMAPSIYITNGLFYTDTLTDPSLNIDRLGPNGKRDERYRQIAVRIAANIDFDQSAPVKGFATLRFGKDDIPVATMEGDPTGNTRYEVYVENEPLDPDQVMTSDFQDYYQLIKNDLTGQHFDFQFTNRATNNLPCMPGVQGGG